MASIVRSARKLRAPLVSIAGLVVPHSVVVLRRMRADRERRAYVESLLATAPAPARRRFSYEDAVASLTARGLDEQAVRLGSIPPASLEFVRASIATGFRPGVPLLALHIGNFVGVSLAALSSATVDVDAGSRTISIDPNMPHLGIDDPQSHALALLGRLGLQSANLVICGYTLEKTPGTDGVPVEDYDAAEAWEREPACENALPNLERLRLSFDVALMDGSHIGTYARRELQVVARMVRPGGLLFLDDVDDNWQEIAELFSEASAGAGPFERCGHDGRVGVLRRRSYSFAATG
jgi:hypothetical protein